MLAIYKLLIWKEWHEHKWKLASLVAICILPPLLMSTDDSRMAFDFGMASLLTLILYLPLAAAFIGMSSAANETSRGTDEFLAALPVQSAKPAIVKLLAGWLSVLAPVLLLSGIAWLWYFADLMKLTSRTTHVEFSRPFEIGYPLLELLAMVSLVTGSIYLWVAAAGVNSRSEIRAGAIGLSLIVCVWALFFGLLYLFGDDLASLFGDWLRDPLLAALPGGFVAVRPESSAGATWMRTLMGFAITHVPLLVWYLKRFAEAESIALWKPTRSANAASSEGWLSAPRTSPISSILWKQWRESAPIALFAAMAAIGVSLFVAIAVAVSRDYPANATTLSTSLEFAYNLLEFTLGGFVFAGVLSALVAGVGAFVSDLEPGLHTFWRSRPIDPDLWYWTKYAGGLATLLLAFVLPALVIGGLLSGFGPREIEQPLMFALATCGLILVTYASAVLMGCLLRHAVYASLLGILLMYGLAQLASEISDSGLVLTLLGMLALVAISILAWLCVRYDWALRR